MIAEDSQLVGPMKSELELTTYLLLVEPMPCLILLKIRRTTAPIFSNMIRVTKMLFSNLFKYLQSIPVLHSTRNNEFRYCSRSRLTPLQLKDYWQQPRHIGNEEVWWKAHNHVHSGPKRTQGVAPMAQTREEATLLMLIWLEECGLVEGSQFRDLGSHELLSLSLLGGTVTSLWKPSHKRHA